MNILTYSVCVSLNGTVVIVILFSFDSKTYKLTQVKVGPNINLTLRITVI